MPPPPRGSGGAQLACGSGGRLGGPNSDEGTDTVVLEVYMYFVGWVKEGFRKGEGSVCDPGWLPRVITLII